MTLRGSDGREWCSEEGDVFECLLTLRDDVERTGVRLCCNGARRDAWASGMQRDMGRGTSVYLLADVPRGTRPPQVDTLGSAPADAVVSVQEQRAWHSDWLESRGE
jgi:hypothetical protein